MRALRLGLVALPLVAALLLAAPATAQNTLPLAGGQTLQKGQRYASGGHYVVFQQDGNLVVYATAGQPTWALQSVGVDYRRVARIDMQADGNLAAYDASGGYVWSALTADPAAGSRLTLTPGGALQIASPDRRVVWSSDGNLAAAAAAAPTAPAAASSPAMQNGLWQVNEGPAERHRFGRTVANLDTEGFLSGADVPATTAAGWSAAAGWPRATSPGALQWGGPGGTPCRSQANYTYFQTTVAPEPGMGYEIEFMSVDDAARVTVFSGTGGINVPELIGLRDPKTIDLSPFLLPNTANRVVVTLADVCGAGNGIRADLRAVPSAAAAPADAGDGETMTVGGTVIKTGNIQVTLEWDTRVADLDLFVTDPSGARVGYDNTSVDSGGILDVDARAGCRETPSTVENIVWQGTPPSGTYGVTVDHYEQCSGQGPVSYTATLRRGGQVVETWRGSVGAEQEQTYSFTSE